MTVAIVAIMQIEFHVTLKSFQNGNEPLFESPIVLMRQQFDVTVNQEDILLTFKFYPFSVLHF